MRRWSVRPWPFLVALLAATGSCDFIGKDEAAVELSLTASDSTIEAASIQVSVVEADGGSTGGDTYTDLGDWPWDPDVHTVLIVADTADGEPHEAEIQVTLCRSDGSCGFPASLSVTFTPGEVTDESLVLD